MNVYTLLSTLCLYTHFSLLWDYFYSSNTELIRCEFQADCCVFTFHKGLYVAIESICFGLRASKYYEGLRKQVSTSLRFFFLLVSSVNLCLNRLLKYHQSYFVRCPWPHQCKRKNRRERRTKRKRKKESFRQHQHFISILKYIYIVYTLKWRYMFICSEELMLQFFFYYCVINFKNKTYIKRQHTFTISHCLWVRSRHCLPRSFAEGLRRL